MHNNYEYEKVYGVIEVFSLRGGSMGGSFYSRIILLLKESSMSLLIVTENSFWTAQLVLV